tara:strand:- start:61 stop:351 length:291 start_codon:yes stop_codon:yes gene_type:complete
MKHPTPFEKETFKMKVFLLSFVLFIIIIIVGSITSCSKYQVVSEVQLNLYHLHNPKTKDAEIILTKDTLEIGEFYRLKDINIIESPYYSKPTLKSR